MRLKINIDSYYHEIDSTDPETLGRWIVEIFGRVLYPNPSTWIQVQAMPSYVPQKDGEAKMDWIADTRYFHVGEAHTPRELLYLLSDWLDEYEAEKAKADE